MVNKKSAPMLTRSRSTSADLKNTRRPKRNVSPKNLHDDTSGLSWREERELKKALYASLQEARRHSREDQTDDSAETSHCSAPDLSDCHGNKSSSSQSKHNGFDGKDNGSRKSFETGFQDGKKQKIQAQRKFALNSFPNNRPSETLANEGFQKKIHAQRKFAQGSLPSTPQETPSKPKFKVSPVKLFPQRPKTEDFLTYLCFRGTSLLPPHLDLMNVQREDIGEVSHPGTPSANGRPGFTRDSSPASSSTSNSQNNEDSLDSTAMTSRSQTPNRKAARASASTPETAQGFAALRANLIRNKSARTISPLSRRSQRGVHSPGRQTRYSDSYLQSKLMKIKQSRARKSPAKKSVADRLSLKKKAMATLAASKILPQKRNGSQKSSVRNSFFILDCKKPEVKSTMVTRRSSSSIYSSVSQVEVSRKRKSSTALSDRTSSSSSSKKGKVVRTSQRVKNLLKIKSKPLSAAQSQIKRRFTETETHPNKKLSTVPARVISKKGPVTRASSHLRAALTSAKKVAGQKLKLVKKLGRTQNAAGRNRSKESVGISRRESHGSKESLKGDNHIGKKKVMKAEDEVSDADKSPREETSKAASLSKSAEAATVPQCPTFFPTDEQFKDPISYIQSIKADAEPFGMCRIVPPCSWKMESRMIEDMRFTSHIQHIHRMYHRTGPCAHRMECIKKHFESSGSEKFQFPQIGGVEVDLVKLYDIVRKYGGMQRIVDKKKWMKVADAMKIPKQSQERVTKLYEAYCKFLLSYETLSEDEREKIDHTVQNSRQKREKTKSSSPADKCIFRGRSQPLCAYSRAARNIQSMFGQEGEATPEQIEADYWKILEEGTSHVSVQGANLDTSIYGSMFPVKRDNPYSRHPWNLHNFIQSKGSVLHHLGLIADVTVPTLHARMLYTTSSLSANIHNLAEVHYHHQGDPVIWYAVPCSQRKKLKTALQDLVPAQIGDKSRLLSQDSVMVPPNNLMERGVTVSRCVQSIRQFIVIFPSVHHASVSCGYSLAESVHYANQDWIPNGCQAAEDLSDNQESEQFSMDAMLVFLAQDSNTPESTLTLVLPYLEKVVDREIAERQKLFDAGLKTCQKVQDKVCKTSHRTTDVIEEINICDVSGKICYLSMVLNESENSAFSLEKGLSHIQKKRNLKHCKLMYRYSQEELLSLIHDVKEKLQGSPNSSLSSPKKKLTRKSDQGKTTQEKSPQTTK